MRQLKLTLILLSSIVNWLMGTVRSFDWLVSSTLKSKPDIEDGFAEVFQEKYLFIKINKNNV